ncbi:hypothetical protein MHU86_14418 [Fragilaria crotonensis]|nr:hypothetical protein MHU86_14418 [Fragilaria crotonensis]
MAHKRTQNEENEDPETECVGQIGGVQKKRRAGNNVNTRATRSSRAAELETPSHEGDSNVSDEDDDDDPVVLQRNNGGRPSRGPPIVDNRTCGQIGNMNVAPPANVVDNGRPPSRDFPFVGGGRGSQVGNGNVGTGANVVNNGGFHPETIHLLTAGVAARLETAMLLLNWHGGKVGDGNVAGTGANVVNNGGLPSRDYTLVGVRREGQQRADNRSSSNPFQGRQVDGQQRLVGDGNGLHGLQEWTAQEVQEGGGIEQHGVTLLPQQQERRAMSYRTAKGLTKKNIRDRIQVTVKTVIFRGVKFITCKEYFDMVMQVILDQEKPADTPQFVRMYKTIVMGALNTKRSTCEQSAQEAAMKLLKIKNHVDEVDPPPYSMDTLCKLRQSQTVEEKEAFLWFAGELLECVWKEGMG